MHLKSKIRRRKKNIIWFYLIVFLFSGLINNIASKYDLETTQITVSSVEKDGMTSFQVMPFYIENLEDFQKKMDQIDDDVCLFIK
jgi:hypothetical protein